MKQRGGDRDVVEAEVGENQRDSERVRDVGLPRAADLFRVSAVCSDVGPFDERGVGLAVGLEERFEHGRQRHIDLLAPPRQDGAPFDAQFGAGGFGQAHGAPS